MRDCILICFFMLAFGCAVMPQKDSIEASKAFRHDVKIKVNDRWFVGFAIPEKSVSGKYMLEIEPPGSKVDRLIVTTCHRQDVIDKPESIGWFKKSVQYSYEPRSPIETSMTCPMKIATLEEQSRSVGFAFIDFPDSRPEYDLSFKSTCNGQTQYFIGRGYCQSAESLVERIEFPERVIVTPTSQSAECRIFDKSPQEKLEFKIPKGLCTYQFVSKRKALNGENIKGRFHTFGVSDVPVRF